MLENVQDDKSVRRAGPLCEPAAAAAASDKPTKCNLFFVMLLQTRTFLAVGAEVLDQCQ